MISDSVPWREDLIRISRRLRTRDVQRRWTERTYYLVERDIMFGAYSIRRLIESRKTSTRLPQRRLRVRQWPLTGRVPRPLDRFFVTDFYDKEKQTVAEVDVARLCNQVIHSFFFQLALEDDGTTSLAVTSDRGRVSSVMVISLEQLAELFDYVGREDVLDWNANYSSGAELEERISNHDLVESGRARYADADCDLIELTDGSVPEVVQHHPRVFPAPPWGR
ncbi:hypothetical protein [Gryllotalpicola kribbensis]|uniref:hypothetical protein n=1 Tax=Gryllotalpicola kribbensis TaxID=993084 RepID=UPI0031CF9373